MKRRAVLASLGTISLAGCSGQLEESNSPTTTTEGVEAADSGPPHYEQVELSGPSEVTVGDEFYFEVSVANTGGRAGDFTTTLTFGEGLAASDIGIEIPDVASGERKTKKFGPYHFENTGEYTARITDHALQHSIAATSIEAGMGRTQLPNGVTVSLDDISFYTNFVYTTDDSDERHLLAESGMIYSVLSATVENNSDESKISPTLNPSSGEVVEELHGYVSDLTYLDEISNQIAGVEVAAGESVEGQYLFKHPISAVEGSLEFTWQNDYSEESDPEAIFEVPTSFGEDETVPGFEIEEISAPETPAVGTGFEVDVTVRNTASSERTFAGLFQYRTGEDDDWSTKSLVEQSIPAGSSATFTRSFWFLSHGEKLFRIARFDETATVDYVEPTLELGETYAPATDLEVTVDKLVTAGQYMTESTMNDPVQAPEGEQYLFAHCNIVNNSDEGWKLPDNEYVDAVVDGEDYAAEDIWISSKEDRTLINPVDGLWWLDPSGIGKGEDHSRWLVFAIPDHVDTDKVKVRIPVYLTSFDTVSATWEN